ncbi:hypothetical protein KFE25_010383 [Diacronema lutheri]|uniref:Uncharacterized protein n=2 Tax=Diacronema lutheri TaxID=2081491 RepID=A0A8J5X9X0_DIALT|nr:hypothetical protein KFE25_010383 [Diacronema lutheri]
MIGPAAVLVALLAPASCARGARASGARAAARSSATVRMMYSDSRPTLEYMEFLRDGAKDENLNDGPALVVGGGRMGSLLLGKGGFDGDLLLRRGEPIPADFEGAVHVCVPNAELLGVIDSCPPEKYDDLVFWQEPQIEPVLKRRAMAENTQVCAYFSVPARGGKPRDVMVAQDLEPDGLTSVTGKWSAAVMQRLARAELSCKQLNKRDYRRAAIERHIFICAYHLVGTVQGHMSGRTLTIGEVDRFSYKEIEPMVRQLGYTSRTMLSAAPKTGLEERLSAVATAVADTPCELVHFKTRNGFWYDYAQMALTNKFDDPMTLHTEYCQYALDNGLASGM